MKAACPLMDKNTENLFRSRVNTLESAMRPYSCCGDPEANAVKGDWRSLAAGVTLAE